MQRFFFWFVSCRFFFFLFHFAATPQTVRLMSQAIADMKEGGCIYQSWQADEKDSRRPSLEECLKWTDLVHGSLLGNACRAAMVLAGHGEEMQCRLEKFGRHLAIASHVRVKQRNAPLPPSLPSPRSPPHTYTLSLRVSFLLLWPYGPIPPPPPPS